MIPIDLNKLLPGLNFNGEGLCNICLWAPYAEKAAISLPGKELTLPLVKSDLGYWHLTTEQVNPGDLYQFVLDHNKILPDPASLGQPEGVHGPSQALDLKGFRWSDEEWKNPPLEDYILYELHTGAFTPEGTFEAAEAKLDHLVRLGVNAVELMPLAQFPGTRNWGYDGVFPYAVQHSYGGLNGLKQLVNACHKKGIAVVLDVVYNHMGPEGNYFNEYGPYFTDKYSTPWGKAINFDDAWCDEVRRYFIENALMWFRDFHVDALRLDAVHAIKDFSPVHILQEIRLYVNRLTEITGRGHYLLVESDLNDTRFINTVEEHGYGMNAQWTDEFHHALQVTATGESGGYYADFNGIAHLAKAYQDAYVYTGEYSAHRKKRFGIKAEKNPGSGFIVFSQNHDQVGNRMLGERSSSLVSFEMLKLLAGAVMVSPYLPLLFMGEEWAEPNPFLYFVSHTDTELADAVRKGRKAEFAAFHAEGEAPDPSAEDTFERSKLQWARVGQGRHRVMFAYYQALIQVRKQNAALHTNRNSLKVTVDEKRNTLLLHRRHKEGQVCCLMNFSKEQQQAIFPQTADLWRKLLDSAGPQWQGPADAPELVSKAAELKLYPESLLIYTADDV